MAFLSTTDVITNVVSGITTAKNGNGRARTGSRDSGADLNAGVELSQEELEGIETTLFDRFDDFGVIEGGTP